MHPQTKPAKKRNSAKVNLLISLTFHGTIIVLLTVFAAREGLLGKQLQKITVELVKQKPPEKPKEPEKPKDEPPPPQQIAAKAPPMEVPKAAAVAPSPVTAPPPSTGPVVAPAAMEIPSLVFDGGVAVQTSSDPVELYRGSLEYSLRSRWNRPSDLADDTFVAEVEVAVAKDGAISSPSWKKTSGNSKWDASVRAAVAATKSMDRPPPKGFPDHVLVRFDVQQLTEPVQTP